MVLAEKSKGFAKQCVPRAMASPTCYSGPTAPGWRQTSRAQGAGHAVDVLPRVRCTNHLPALHTAVQAHDPSPGSPARYRGPRTSGGELNCYGNNDMGRIGLAFKAFFGILFNQATAERVASTFHDEALPKLTTPEPPAAAVEKGAAKPLRSEALTLLEALQREARLVDLCQESLDPYSDEQIGAAARNVIRDCGKTLDRFFGLAPVSEGGEGSELSVPAGFDPARYRLTGNVAGEPPYRGRVVHAGWQATRCELPQWTGGKGAALIVAPAEVEVV
jgi:hypothetical protein